jgi:hypothetical protein
MVLTIVMLSLLLTVAAVSIAVVIRDVRRMHAAKQELADSPIDAAGASAAGMIFYGNTFTH